MQNIIRAAVRTITGIKPVSYALRPIVRHDFIPESVTARLPVEFAFPVELPGSGPIECRFTYESTYGDGLGRELFWNGWKAWRTTGRVYYELCKSAITVLDAGANTGVYTLAALAANPLLKVISIEPVPRVFDRLQRNIELNRWGTRVVLLRKAV